MEHHLEPLAIFLVKKGGNGDRVLFRYPYPEPMERRNLAMTDHSSPYAVRDALTDVARPSTSAAVVAAVASVASPAAVASAGPGAPTAASTLASSTALSAAALAAQALVREHVRLSAHNLVAFPSKVISHVFAVSPRLCGEKFELKVDEVRFVGHPVSLEVAAEEEKYIYRKKANYSVVQCYHDLSKRLSLGIRYEERLRQAELFHCVIAIQIFSELRCSGFFTSEAKIMTNAQDEVATHPLGSRLESPFAVALERSELARTLKKVFEDVSKTGFVDIRFNNWSEVLFCLPQKVHKKVNPNLLVEPHAIRDCLKALRPYHALLLLHDEKELLEQLPIDANAALKKIIVQASPLKNFVTLAADTAISKLMVFYTCGHLLYWGKAAVIYPLCNSNVYVLSPNVPNHMSPVLVEKFADRFQGESLAQYLNIFSYPNSINQALPSISNKEQVQMLARVIVWCLQHHLLVQLHTYITLALTEDVDTGLDDPTETPPAVDIAAEECDDCVELENGDEDDDEEEEEDESEDEAEEFDEELDGPDAASERRRQRIVWRTMRTHHHQHQQLHHHHHHMLVRRRNVSRMSRDELLSGFSEAERKAIVRVPAADNVDDLRLFVRLAPYFNGRHHVEEIMYYENVRRSQLLQMADKFRQLLVRHEHEDPAVTMYFSTSIK